MPSDLTDPIQFAELVFLGPLMPSILLGFIDSYLSPGNRATLSMRLGMRMFSFFILSFKVPVDNSDMIRRVDQGKYTFLDKVVGSVGGIWITLSIFGFVVVGAWVVFNS